MKVFVSYSHQQSDWVRDDLVPVLKAGGAEVLIDHQRFRAGYAVVGQMDSTQDQAERHVLCLSAAYAGSEMCLHEMRRAVAFDPGFENGLVLPIQLDGTPLPAEILAPHPLRIDLRNVSLPEPWRLLLEGCGANLGVSTPAWLSAREAVIRELGRGHSVNLVVLGPRIAGAGLVHGLRAYRQPDLAVVDLTNPATIPRKGFCLSVLQALGSGVTELLNKPDDLLDYDKQLESLGRPARVALVNFDIAVQREDYDANFYNTLRWQVTESRRLQLLVHSRRPFTSLLPRDNPLSTIDLKLIELR